MQTLCVRYLEEEGVDAGGLKREFLTQFMGQLCQRYFDSSGEFCILQSSVDQNEAELCGFMLGYSIIQGGPPIQLPDYFYQVLVFSDVDKSILSSFDIPLSLGFNEFGTNSTNGSY